MSRMTDEGADALDRQLTETTPKLTTVPGLPIKEYP
jgi:hypothetical protein